MTKAVVPDQGPVREASRLKVWHRRLGLSAAVFVLILAITGLVLNHTGDWGLDKQTISASPLLNWYGINSTASLVSYPLGDKLVTRVGDELFLDTREIAHCGGDLIGALELSDKGFNVVACNGELFVLSSQYELVERLGMAHGLPAALEKIGRQQNQLILSAGGEYFLADLDNLSWAPVIEVAQAMIWSQSVTTPSGLGDILGKHFSGEGITVERLLLDIHSGRIVGNWGPYLVDLMAIIFVILVITGFIMWRREPSRRR